MSDAPSTRQIVCRSYAKINLYLDVLRKRSDGFHQLETIFQTVSLFDELVCCFQECDLTLSIEGIALAVDEDNLVLRAARALRKASGTEFGAQMQLRKSIPVAAGLAGGSGDAASALRGLNLLWGLGLTDKALEAIAAELGSDVPYCLYGGTLAGTGRGENLTPLKPLPETWFVLMHPEIAVSTATIFTHPALEKSGVDVLKDGLSAGFSVAISDCERGRLDDVLFNALESAAFLAYPEIVRCKQALVSAGCKSVLMSGSGPTVFGVCRSRKHAQEVAGRIEGYRTTVVHSVDTGVALDEVE